MEVKFKEFLSRDYFRLDLEIVKIVLFFLLSISIVTQGVYDPAPFNLLWPPGGIENWLGLPGSVVGGNLTFLLGWSALFIPFIFIFFSRKKGVSYWKFCFNGLLTTLTFNTFVALLIPQEISIIRDWTGLWGLTSTQTLADFSYRIAFISISGLYLIRFFIKNRFNPKLFLIISRLSIGSFSLILFCILLAKNLYQWIRTSYKHWLFDKLRQLLDHYSLPGRKIVTRRGKHRLQAYQKGQKNPLVFYKDLLYSNQKIPIIKGPTLNPNDLKRQEVLQQTLDAMDKEIPNYKSLNNYYKKKSANNR